MSRGKKNKKHSGSKSTAKMARKINEVINDKLEQLPEPKKRFSGGRTTDVHGKIGTAKERHDRRQTNAKLKNSLKNQKFDEL